MRDQIKKWASNCKIWGSPSGAWTNNYLTPKSTKFLQIILQASVCTSQEICCVSIFKTSWLMLFRKINTVCQHHINHINTICGQTQSSCSVKTCGKIQYSSCFKQKTGNSPQTPVRTFLCSIERKHKYVHVHAHKQTKHTHTQKQTWGGSFWCHATLTE